MIEQDEMGFGFTVSCDFCSDYEELDVQSFYEAIEEMRSLGWKPIKENDEWLHRCPSCCECE